LPPFFTMSPMLIIPKGSPGLTTGRWLTRRAVISAITWPMMSDAEHVIDSTW
jgi:hypothetical protein